VDLLPFDATIVQAVNGELGVVHRFDEALYVLNGNPLAKGIPFMGAIWWLDARERRASGGSSSNTISFLARALAGLLVALILARWLQNHGPFHARPLSDQALGLKRFIADDYNYFRKWNSFPSDHAVQFFAMSYAIATRKVWAGLCAFAWTLLIILLPRLYFGYHYPSDIITGAVLVVAVMAIALQVPAPAFLLKFTRWIDERFYGFRQAALFVVSAEVAMNFENIRDILHALKLA
jgi:undecaprenyl-diphosphatase